MILYQLHIWPDEYQGEGENMDEYFSSLEAASARRRGLIAGELVAQAEYRAKMEEEGHTDYTDYTPLSPTGTDYQIDKLTISRKSRKRLVLAILNRTGYVVEREIACKAYAWGD